VAPEDEDFGKPNGPLSWRDVYRAVEESERRILKALADGLLPLQQNSSDHERRLRMIEDIAKDSAKVYPRLEGIVMEYHRTTDQRLESMDRALLVAKAKADERGHLLLSTRTIVISIISIVTSIIVASAGAIAMLDRIAK
jgi:hypothetical protein